MTTKIPKYISGISALALIALSGIRPAHASLDVYLSEPQDTVSSFTNTTTETFDELSTGIYSSPLTTAIGTYNLSDNSKLAIQPNDQYGAGSQYAAFGSQSNSTGAISLQLNAPVSYFGFMWDAGDANNGISFYNGNTFLGRFSTQTILGMLTAPTVTAINGSTYNSSQYLGQPGTGADGNEPFSFINIIDTGGMFDRVVFDNSGTTGTGFETDNHTIRTDAPTPLGSFVSVGPVPIPEPSGLALLSTCLVGTVSLVRRRKA